MSHLMIASIGAGGKSTTMRCLARQFQSRSVLFTTTTHILPLSDDQCRLCLRDPDPELLLSELTHPGILCAGVPDETIKFGSLPLPLLEQAAAVADVTLYEADGAKRLPLKLHREGEPVILPQTDRCVVVAGLSALGKPIGEIIHRYQRNPQWKDHPEQPVGPEEFVTCLLDAVDAARLPKDRFRILLNQSDTLSSPEAGEAIVTAMTARGLVCRMGSLARDPSFLPDWVLS